MATTQTDLLQKFIDNEKKSKTWTFISVLIFVILGGIIIYQASRIKQNEKRLEDNEKLLYLALGQADSLNDALEEQETSLKNASEYAVSLKKQYDSLLAKINVTAI